MPDSRDHIDDLVDWQLTESPAAKYQQPTPPPNAMPGLQQPTQESR